MENDKKSKYGYLGSGADIKAKSGEYYGVFSPDDLYAALKKVWCKKTCSDKLKGEWSQKNVTLGQCSITAFLAQDIFGGTVLGGTLKNGAVHCFNKVDGKIFDLTIEQFGDNAPEYLSVSEQNREEHFSDKEKYERYELLKSLLKNLTDRNFIFADNALIGRDITETLIKLGDKRYARFLADLLPDRDKTKILGVRSPDLKRYAKLLYGGVSAQNFMKDLPHKYLEENTLHAFLINEEKDLSKCVSALGEFLPFVDNWATCDSIKPKAFAKNKKEILPQLYCWAKSDAPFAVRYAVGGFMTYALGEDLDGSSMKLVADISSQNYYVNMMRAWYFATALVKNKDDALKYFLNGSLDTFTHNKALQKATESFRVADEDKKYFKSLKR